MKYKQPYPLTDALKQRARNFFGQNLDEVRLVQNPSVSGKGTWAWAEGNLIHLHPQLATFSHRQHLEVLGHELTHVVQQRAGLTPQGSDFLIDEALEAQAIDWGKRFAHGGSIDVAPVGNSKRTIRQPLVTVGGNRLVSEQDLTFKAQRVIDLINDGQDWLSQAISDSSDHYSFDDETNLAIGVQLGLHGRELMMLANPSLLVHPASLMALNQVQLEALSIMNGGGEENSVAQVESDRTLITRGLLTFDDLSLTQSFLGEVGLANHAMFQSLGLGDQLSIYRALQGADIMPALAPSMQTEAAQFALDYAASVIEFCDYFQYYMSLLNRQPFRDSASGSRARSARELLEGIATAVRNDLQCPVAPGLLTPDQIKELAQSWVSGGKSVGFARISRAVYQLALRDEIVAASGKELDELVRTWLRRAQILITNQTASAPIVSQDGAALYYRISDGSQTAILSLDTGMGFLSLFTYNPGGPLQEENRTSSSRTGTEPNVSGST